MIGVDTSVLVRLLTADDPKQYEATVAFFAERSPSDPAYISSVTLAETTWVLRRIYKLPSNEISGSLRMLFDSDDFIVEGSLDLEPIRQGLAKPSQIADFLIGHLGSRAKCSHTVSFDRRAAKAVSSMELLA